MLPDTPIVQPLTQLSAETGWLSHQVAPVIAWGNMAAEEAGRCDTANADVVVSTEAEAARLVNRIAQRPVASLILVEVLRAIENLSILQGLRVESLAYSTLQSGLEFQTWLSNRNVPPEPVRGALAEPAVALSRQGDVLAATLNRPEHRNSLSVEMRDALIEALELLDLDLSIECLELSGRGKCFCVGGELREFGLAQDPAKAHWVRTSHSPAQLIAQNSDRVVAHLHGACIGSGIELPAFAGRVYASPRSYFQLPELDMGLIPGAGGCVSISRRIGRQRAAWMMLSGKRINVSTALDWGLIDQITH